MQFQLSTKLSSHAIRIAIALQFVSFVLRVFAIVSSQIVEVLTEIMTQRSNSVEIRDLQDITTPVGEPLSGKFKRSFAYATIKDRLPVILTKIIDTLSRDKQEIIKKYGGETAEEIKHMIGVISKMKSEMVTNKALKPLTLIPGKVDDDALVWNAFLDERTEIEGETPMWFNTIWLYCECYMYRRIAQELSLTQRLKDYDPFEKQKQDGFNKSMNSIIVLSQFVMDLINTKAHVSAVERKHEFVKLLKLNLWGNRCDLSLSGGAKSSQSGNPLELLDSFEKDILVNDTQFLWDLLSKNNSGSVDIVLDNSGYELFTDLCLAAFFTSHKLTVKIRFYVKRYPWYVSDVTVNDFHWTVETMKNSNDENLKSLGEISSNYLKTGVWTVEEEKFWTEPYTFSEMKKHDPTLYAKLSEATLVIFKGDLNYRKLLGDINWEYTTDFVQALQGFKPTNVVSLRTLKCDICVGLFLGQAEEIAKKDKNWLITGQYGIIQATINTKCDCPRKS